MAINDWLRRMSRALRAGWSAFNEKDMTALADSGYDEYAARMTRYSHNELYATNTIFTALELYRQQHKNEHDLYRHIRPIKNPVARLVKMEVAKTYGGNIDYANDLKGGAIPFVGASPRVIKAGKQLYNWSNMGAIKNQIVHQGAVYGDAFLKIIDDTEAGKVRIELLDARKVKDVTFDPVDNINSIVIEYNIWNPTTKRDEKYTETIDKEWFRTYKDDQPFAYYKDASGSLVWEWRNDYGFVPVRLIKHQETVNAQFGATSFSTVIYKIDEAMDVASAIHDFIRRNVNPPWAMAGDFKLAPGGTKITNPSEERDEQPFIKLPAGTTVTSLVHPLNLADAMVVLNDQTDEIEKDLPQLSLQRIRERSGDVSGVGIRMLYGDASDELLGIQGNYDAGVLAVTQMGITIGGMRGYRNFEGFDLNSYADGEIEFSIAPRPIFPDEIDKQQKITLVLQAADSPAMRVIMEELGYSDEQITQIEDAKADTESAAMRGLATAAFGNSDEDEDVIDGETETVNALTATVPGSPETA